jgi:hypothetical protein
VATAAFGSNRSAAAAAATAAAASAAGAECSGITTGSTPALQRTRWREQRLVPAKDEQKEKQRLAGSLQNNNNNNNTAPPPGITTCVTYIIDDLP